MIRGSLPARAVVLVSFFLTTSYALRLLYRRTGSPQLALLALWLFLSWFVPMAIDTAGWYLAEDRQDVLRTASGFSPLGALIEVWTGSPGITTPGLSFQVCLAAAVANLTLLAATSSAASTADSMTLGALLAILAALLGRSRRIVRFRLVALGHDLSDHLDQPIGHFYEIIRPLTPPCQPGS